KNRSLLPSNPKNKAGLTAKEVLKLISRLNLLYQAIVKGTSKNIDDALEILQKLRLAGYTFKLESTWEFFDADVFSAGSNYFELYKQFLIAGKITSSHLLQDQHHEALHWQQKR